MPEGSGQTQSSRLYTKHLDQATSEGHTNTLNYRLAVGRAKEAPKSHGIWKTVGEYLMTSEGNEWRMLQLLTERR